MNKPKNIKLIISYDGTDYSGWQRQKNKKTIQGVIEDTLRNITGEKELKLYGSGRTDAGVHAIGQVANFKTRTNLPVDKWNIVLNNLLPRDIRVKFAKEVYYNFHARYNAKSRLYKYNVINKFRTSQVFNAKDLFLSRYFYFYNYPLEIERMEETAQYLIGSHDFSALSCLNQKREKSIKNNFRYIKKIAINKKGPFITFSIEADSFLYKMVRKIVGTLLEFSIMKREPRYILDILKERDNQKSGMVIPPSGLYLVKVKYK